MIATRKVTIGYIDELSAEYASTVEELQALVQKMEDGLKAVRNSFSKGIAELAAEAGEKKGLLHEAIKEAPDLFEKPRTFTMHGIKVGFRKQKGEIVVNDQARTIELIRKRLPETFYELVMQKLSVDKKAVAKLSGEDLKAIGVQITEDTDEVVIKSAVDSIYKLVDQIIEEFADIEQ